MKPELDLLEFERDVIEIILDLRYGGDEGESIRYNKEERIWELLTWSSNEPSVIEKSENPFILIRYQRKLT